ncbi:MULTISPECIES: DUF3558 family protein [unclassified Crossiella]|uniref:DUF3558 family protein n=1 Tax=unclassified Crossiella TaxID=2620835 RepID=UPI0020000A4C|nr:MULTISPECIES: DUF3558 family protein [unclassified Crossiella]MCK2244953.1 DUF3558 domain-containing protein [Crossiella sp. S99.2]MCK2258494.1 DUF3558 domain-containing protein [Crossiella sp. S99.1]
MARRCWALAAVLLAALSAACTAEAPAPQPGPSTVVKEWTKVGQPKSVDKGFRTKPCESLTTAERRTVGLPSAPVQAAAEEPAGCTWRNQASGAAVRVELDQLSLAQRFDHEPSGAGVTVVQVAGYPAVRAKEGADQRGCTLRIGVSATEALAATFSSPSTRPEAVPDACAFAQQVAERVLATLPEGS